MLEAGFGSPSDAAAAAIWYRRCISASFFGQNVDALNGLAKLLSRGSVEPQGTENAIDLWKQAADKGGSTEAALELATHYDMDELTDAEAQKWYARASALGDTNATRKLHSPWYVRTRQALESRFSWVRLSGQHF
jgi:TPR repeat protein